MALMVINPDSVFNGGYFKVGKNITLPVWRDTAC